VSLLGRPWEQLTISQKLSNLLQAVGKIYVYFTRTCHFFLTKNTFPDFLKRSSPSIGAVVDLRSGRTWWYYHSILLSLPALEVSVYVTIVTLVRPSVRLSVSSNDSSSDVQLFLQLDRGRQVDVPRASSTEGSVVWWSEVRQATQTCYNLEQTFTKTLFEENESVLIQLAKCWFPRVAFSNAKI